MDKWRFISSSKGQGVLLWRMQQLLCCNEHLQDHVAIQATPSQTHLGLCRHNLSPSHLLRSLLICLSIGRSVTANSKRCSPQLLLYSVQLLGQPNFMCLVLQSLYRLYMRPPQFSQKVMLLTVIADVITFWETFIWECLITAVSLK